MTTESSGVSGSAGPFSKIARGGAPPVLSLSMLKDKLALYFAVKVAHLPITERLLADGIIAFTHSLDELLASLKEKRRVLLESQAAQKGGIRSARIA